MTASSMSAPTATLPEYTPALVDLARAYDCAALAVKASLWHLASLRDDVEHFQEGDDSLSDWTRVRIALLEDQLVGMADAINGMIVAESKPWFEIVTGSGPGIWMPAEVELLLEPYSEAAFYYRGHEEGLAKAQEYLVDHYVILFEGNAYTLPRSYPKSFIEIWWRRYWWNMSSATFYEMAMVENPAYGWDCYGHER